MANASTTGFGLRPIQKIGQNDNNAGLSEWLVAASSAAMYHNDMVMLTADGVVLRSTDSSANNLGSLNGVFYTDATTSKPTFQNYLQSGNTASDIQALVNDNPLQMYEIRADNTGAAAQGDVGKVADIVYAAGSSPNYVSGAMLDDSDIAAGASKQLKIVGLSRDPDNRDLTAAGVVWRVVINESFFLDDSGI